MHHAILNKQTKTNKQSCDVSVATFIEGDNTTEAACPQVENSAFDNTGRG